jgi:hypothetical protein
MVNIYNSSSNRWTNASLSQPRDRLAATTVGNLALFAGGENGTVSFDWREYVLFLEALCNGRFV